MIKESINPEHYAYQVIWSPEDEEYIGLCTEFPSLSWLDESLTQALLGIVALVKDVVHDMLLNGESIPKPLSAGPYNGNIQIQIPHIGATVAA